MTTPHVTVTLRGVVATRLTDYATRCGVSEEQAARELIDGALDQRREAERIRTGRPRKLTYGGLATG